MLLLLQEDGVSLWLENLRIKIREKFMKYKKYKKFVINLINLLLDSKKLNSSKSVDNYTEIAYSLNKRIK